MGKHSRAEWAQIVKRALQVNFKFDPKWKCILCGQRFSASGCSHTVAENEALLLEVKETTSTS